MIYRKPVPDQVDIGFLIMVEHQTSGTFVLVVGRVMRYLICCTGTADLYLAVPKAILNLFLGPPPPGGPGGGSGLSVSQGNQRFGADISYSRGQKSLTWYSLRCRNGLFPRLYDIPKTGPRPGRDRFWIMFEHQTSGTFVLVVGRVMRYLVCCTGTAGLHLAVLKAIFNLFLGPPPPGGPG